MTAPIFWCVMSRRTIPRCKGGCPYEIHPVCPGGKPSRPVLSKVSGLFSRRGFNIDSLAVGITEDPAISRMTIVVDGDEHVVEQVEKQLE